MDTTRAPQAEAGPLEWMASAQAFALVLGAHHAGLLDATERPRPLASLARAIQAPLPFVRAMCEALTEHGVLVRTRAGYVQAAWLSPWRSERAPLRFQDLLGAQEASLARLARPELAVRPLRGKALEAEAVAAARGVSGQPGAPLALEDYRRQDAQMPEVAERWAAGGWHLELGCGAGRDLLRIVVMYPKARAVGVELHRAVKAEALREARKLGVARRVSFRVEDATRFTSPRLFGSVLWSQIFFPRSTRAATLARARACLEPGGHLLVPIPPGPGSPPKGTPAARGAALRRVVLASRGLEDASPLEVRRECERAHFRFVRTVRGTRTDTLLFLRS